MTDRHPTRTLKRQRPVEVRLADFGVTVFESAHAPLFSTDLMSHAFHKILLPVNGSGCVSVRRRQLSLLPDQATIVPAGVSHRLDDTPGQPVTLLALCLDPGVLVDRIACTSRAQTVALPAHRVHETRRLLRQMLFEQSTRKPGYRSLILGLAHQLVVLIERVTRTTDDKTTDTSRQRVMHHIDRLNGRFFEHITVDRAAEHCGMSRRRFTTLFRQITGESYRRYIERLRIDHARQLLTTTDHSILSIAFECGFDDVTSFYRSFARHESHAPGHYRRTHT
ncbi:AraC family transcriptional regulator [Mucisphaera calidilacus]|uniref:Melibiose operon regulatory protein n=1 Tax=Mucisphaera calidilacus TaxID=2527982 RepID=A0A518BU33_9BACT|nr:AraC family transcriptional regulator [Mucisphaera calidilacus]QDU70492.1 Melibiose operon regulatory protein [Mucisphaera calidilacus]